MVGRVCDSLFLPLRGAANVDDEGRLFLLRAKELVDLSALARPDGAAGRKLLHIFQVAFNAIQADPGESANRLLLTPLFRDENDTLAEAEKGGAQVAYIPSSPTLRESARCPAANWSASRVSRTIEPRPTNAANRAPESGRIPDSKAWSIRGRLIRLSRASSAK